MRSFYLAFSLSLGLAATAWGAAGPATGTSGSSQLQGEWQAVAAQRNGAPAPDLVGHRLAFTKDRFRIMRDGTLLYGGTYTTDPSARPARIDFHQDEGAALRGEWRGIYRFEGDRLEIVDNADDVHKPRPTRFTTAPGSGYVLVRFEPR